METLDTLETEDLCPLPKRAKCVKCGYNWVGRDAIVSPTLASCACFWCGGDLRPHRGARDFAIKDRSRATQMHRSFERIVWLDSLSG